MLVDDARVFCAFAIGHALEGAGHTGYLAGLVPDRLASGAEPAISSCLGEEPVFHVVEIMVARLGGQGGEDTVGILGMKPGGPALQDIGKFLVGITQHGFDARRPPHRCARGSPGSLGSPSIPEAVIGASDHEFQAFFALIEEMFCLLDLHREFRDPDGSTERMPKFLPIIRFREIGIGPLCQRSHGTIRGDMGGQNHDGGRGLQALGFFQDLEPIAVRQAQVQQDDVEAMGSNEFDGAGDGAGNGDGVAIMVQHIL